MIRTKFNDWVPERKIEFDSENVTRFGLRTYLGTNGAQWYTGLRIITSSKPDEEVIDGHTYDEEGYVNVHENFRDKRGEWEYHNIPKDEKIMGFYGMLHEKEGIMKLGLITVKK